jgi:chromosome segregation ATPase
MSDDLGSVAEELYALAPGDFTGARDDAGKQAKSDGDPELAARIQKLKKPSTAAWVVNLLVREDADEVAQMLDVGEALQRAQADLDGDALRELNRQRRKLISVMAQKGRSLARDHGVKVSGAVAEQVEQTLHAAMVDSDAAAAVRTGMLIEPLAPEGFGGLKVANAMVHTALGQDSSPARKAETTKSRKGASRKAGLSAVPEEDPEERRQEQLAKAREEATAAIAAAEADLAEAKSELTDRKKRVDDLQAACLQVNGEIDQLKRRIDELEDRLEQLDDEAEGARAGRDEAAEAVALAESALGEARRRLSQLDDGEF